MGKIKLSVNIAKLCIMLVFLTSCAQSSYLLDNSKFTPFKEFNKTSMFDRSSEVMSLSIVDGREDKQFLGMAKTGARYTETPFVAEVTPQIFLETFYTKELSRRGLTLSGSAEAQIEIVINELWVDEIQEKFKGERARCQIDLSLFAKKDIKSFKGSYWAKIESAANLSDGTDHLTPTLASCLNVSIEKIVKDVKFSTFLKN